MKLYYTNTISLNIIETTYLILYQTMHAYMLCHFSHVPLFTTLWTIACRLRCPSPSLGACSNSRPLSWWYNPTISSSVIPFSSCFQSFPASGFFFFSCESALSIRWPKYGSFSFNVSSSSEYSELISFRIDWFDLLRVQGTLKSVLQHHNSKASVLQRSAFITVQLSHLYLTTIVFNV